MFLALDMALELAKELLDVGHNRGWGGSDDDGNRNLVSGSSRRKAHDDLGGLAT